MTRTRLTLKDVFFQIEFTKKYLGNDDELNVCAEYLAEMEEMSDVQEMYVCTNYLKEEQKLRIMVGRPNYNSQDLEAATIILSVSVFIDESNFEGPPRYYSLASGMSHVYVKQIYVTNLDRVVCTGEYELAENPFSTGTYQSCEVPCHSECVGGCNKKEDSRACMECENHKLFYSGARFDCISDCGLTPAVLSCYILKNMLRFLI